MEQHYLKCIDVPSASVAGILILCGHRFLTARPTECRLKIWEHLHNFLQPLLAVGDFEIVLNGSTKHILAINSTPASGGIELAIDKGSVDATALFSESFGLHEYFNAALGIVRDYVEVDTTMPVATFTMLVFATGLDILITEVLSQLAALIDFVLPQFLCDNPLDITEEVQSVGKRARQDKKSS